MISKYHKKLNDLHEIPDIEYEGYLWMSDEIKPIIIDGKYSIFKNQINPFIVEGNLLSKDKSVSISIRHAGNQLMINQYNLNEMAGLLKDPEQFTYKKYLAHRLDGIRFLNFILVWLPERIISSGYADDLNQEDFEALKPAFTIFNGFEKN